MKSKLKITRRSFFRFLLYSTTIPIMLLWKNIIDTGKKINGGNRLVEIPLDIPIGLTFHDGIIINKTENSLTFMAAKCTHLGCRINKADSKNIICPCHGSRYSFDGNVVSGPASKPLRQLTYRINKNMIEVEVDG